MKSGMPSGNHTIGLPRGAAADLWRRTLSQVPSLFGRLVYLSALRSTNSGRYAHYGLIQEHGEEPAHLAMLDSHEITFADWLRSPLEEQKADLDLYLSDLTPDPAAIVETWLRSAPYRNLAPLSARDSERELFQSDFEALLELLRTAYRLPRPDKEDL